MRWVGRLSARGRRAVERLCAVGLPPRRRGRAVFVAESELAGEGAGQGRTLPPRPALPPALACALGLWASCAAVLLSAQGWGVSACLLVGLGGLAAAGAATAALWRRCAVLAWALVLGAALGACCGAWAGAAQHASQEAAAGVFGRCRFFALADGSEGLYGASCLARAALPDGSSHVVQVRLSEERGVPRYGDVFEAEASLAAPSGSAAAYCWRQGAVAQVRVDEAAPGEESGLAAGLLSIRNGAVDLLAERGDAASGVLAALVCGWRGSLDDDVYRSFQATGLAHVVAVSGAHLSIVSAFASSLLRALRVPRAIAQVLQALLLLGYLVLSAAPPSAVRAAVMAFAGMLSFAARRRPAALSALAACMVGCIVVKPHTALSVSFALSALSTLGIVLFAGLGTAWLARLFPRLPRFVGEALALTGASSILATPLSAAMFSQVPLASPIANAVVAPLFAPVCSVGLAAVLAAVSAPAASGFLLTFACGGAEAMVRAVTALACIPHASVPASLPVPAALALSAAMAVALWVVWPTPRKRALAVACALCACAFAACALVLPRLAGDEIVMLDVGQGDAFLIRSRGAAVLVDTGNQEGLLREALARHGVMRLDAVVVTHGDDDHKGALGSLAGVVEVGRVLVANDALSCGCASCEDLVEDAAKLVGADGVQGLSKGDGLDVGAFGLEVVWPDRFADEGGNADSLCLAAKADVDGDGAADWSALFVGDAEREQLGRLVEEGAVGHVDIYKVGHHGSKNALDDKTAAALSPSIALVSAGENNRYGHPAPETIGLLEAAGASVFRTDLQGDVSCKLGPDRIEVRTLR